MVLLPVLVVAACTVGPTTATTEAPTTTEATTTTTATTLPELVVCPGAPYAIEFFPVGVNDPEFDPADIEPDVWTSKGGTRSTLIGRSDGTVAIALIRGTLPAVDWPGTKGVVQIDGVNAAVGPHPDGTWVAGWAVEPKERCDLYTMVFYPPWNHLDVQQVLASMTRTPG